MHLEIAEDFVLLICASRAGTCAAGYVGVKLMCISALPSQCEPPAPDLHDNVPRRGATWEASIVTANWDSAWISFPLIYTIIIMIVVY